jgi:dTDP-4-amino-4,6-dideoxygalactose transaminase
MKKKKQICIPLVDLKIQSDNLKSELMRAIGNVINSSEFILGSHVAEFEKNFACFTGTKFAASVASGTDALHLALRAAGIGRGHEVITAVNTFYATAAAIEIAGAIPVFADCDPQTYLIDPESVEKAVSKRTGAIIPVHLYGQIASMDKINNMAKKYRIAVIEDACHSPGAEYRGKNAGSLGTAGGFSFYPAKNLGAFGDGGAVTTDRKEIYEKILFMRNYGSTEKYMHRTSGLNSRLDSVQAAILNVKIKYLAKWNDARMKAAQRYMSNLKCSDGIILPAKAPDSTHVYHLFVIQVEGDRDKIIRKMADRGIACGIHYPVPLHIQPAFAGLGYKSGDFPNAEFLAKRIISLPIFPEMDEEKTDYVCDCLLRIMKNA